MTVSQEQFVEGWVKPHRRILAKTIWDWLDNEMESTAHVLSRGFEDYTWDLFASHVAKQCDMQNMTTEDFKDFLAFLLGCWSAEHLPALRALLDDNLQESTT